MARSVAFFRNLNLGQGWAPTRLQLVGAFEEAGARDVDSVQVNGTVAFTSPTPVRITRVVLEHLRGLTGYDDVAPVRSATWVQDLVRQLDLLALDDVPCEVSLFDGRPPLPLALPWTAPGGRLTVVAGDHRHAVSRYDPGARRGSNATAVLQRVTGVPVTSRGTDTIRRLAARLRG